MEIKINNIKSLKTPDAFTYTFDNRIEKIQLINGNVVQDYGHIESGDYFTISALFSKTDFNNLMQLWESNQKVTFTDESGEEYLNCRLVIKSYKYQERFKDYVMLEFELWRI